MQNLKRLRCLVIAALGLLPTAVYAPVNVQTGNFYLPVQDLYLPCYGYPLEIFRAYNSVSDKIGPFGKGWTFNFDLRINAGAVEKNASGEDTLALIEPDGFINTYVKVDDPAKAKIPREKFVSKRRGSSTVYKTADGYERVTPEGRSESYFADGRIRAVRDRNDNELAFKYDAKSRLQSVTDACGQTFRLGYNNNGRIADVGDQILRRVTYEYDADQRLVAVTNVRGQTVRYQYDKGRLAKVLIPDRQNPQQFNETRVVYDPASGRAIEQEGPGDHRFSYKYGKRNKNLLVSEMISHLGEKLFESRRYEFFPIEAKAIETDLKNGSQVVTQTAECCNKPESITNGRGQGVFFKYNRDGDMIERKTSAGVITRFTYHPNFHQMASVTVGKEKPTALQYDERGNLVQIDVGTTGAVFKLKYNRRGRVNLITDHSGNRLSFEFNNQGRPTLIEMTEAGRGREKPVGELRLIYEADGSLLQALSQPAEARVAQKIRDFLQQLMNGLEVTGTSLQL